MSSLLYKRFGTTLLEVLIDSKRSTQESRSMVNDCMKYTIFDCLTIKPNTGILTNILAYRSFPV
jgi:hypothetical protein